MNEIVFNSMHYDADALSELYLGVTDDQCPSCGEALSPEILTCKRCGSALVPRILEFSVEETAGGASLTWSADRAIKVFITALGYVKPAGKCVFLSRQDLPNQLQIAAFGEGGAIARAIYNGASTSPTSLDASRINEPIVNVEVLQYEVDRDGHSDSPPGYVNERSIRCPQTDPSSPVAPAYPGPGESAIAAEHHTRTKSPVYLPLVLIALIAGNAMFICTLGAIMYGEGSLATLVDLVSVKTPSRSSNNGLGLPTTSFIRQPDSDHQRLESAHPPIAAVTNESLNEKNRPVTVRPRIKATLSGQKLLNGAKTLMSSGNVLSVRVFRGSEESTSNLSVEVREGLKELMPVRKVIFKSGSPRSQDLSFRISRTGLFAIRLMKNKEIIQTITFEVVSRAER